MTAVQTKFASMFGERVCHSFVMSLVYVLCLSFSVINAQDKEIYQGKPLGKLNSYHHQVAGEVFAVDEFTFLIKNFIYDGNGPDTFFWVGSSTRPGPQGFIIPNEKGRTNVLLPYLNKDFTLKLPDGKKITDIKWLSIYDLTIQENFGDISIEEGFEPPSSQQLTELSRRAHRVSSLSVVIVDSKTISLPEFNYDGLGEDTYFWVGVGPQPSVKGFKVPDEKGYITPLRSYRDENVLLRLPGDLTVFDIDWFSVFNVATGENFGSIIIPDNLNVPPSLLKILPHTSTLPNCEPLHRDLQVSWEIFGPAITLEVAGRVADDEYIAFGLSGSSTEAKMEGADVAIIYMDTYQGYATDYNITAKSSCVSVLGANRGVCRDDQMGGTDNHQFYLGSRVDGLTTITYRRSLIPSDSEDQVVPTDRPASLVWAVGKLDKFKRPTFHRLWSRHPVLVELGRSTAQKNCVPFLDVKDPKPAPWGPFRILEPSLRLIRFMVGPSGGQRGYEGITGQPGSDLAWYVNGFIAPELFLRRELVYNFQVEGGNDPHSPTHYHPLIITDEPIGGYETFSEEQRKEIRVLAGVEFTRRGQPRPIAAGRLCLWRQTIQRDRRLDNDVTSFQKFRNNLQLLCEENGQAANMEIRPDNSWPDVVYYHSYTHPGMGWKINIVDRFGGLTSASHTIVSGFVLPIAILLISVHYWF